MTDSQGMVWGNQANAAAEKPAATTTVTPNEAPKKRVRRGVSNETRSTSRLKFDESRDANRQNGLFVGHLDKIEVTTSTIGEDTQGLPQFAGMDIPVLTLTFASNHEDVNQRRYVTHRFLPAESNTLTIPGGKEAWKVDSVFSWMKHVLDVFLLKGRPMTEAEENALELPFEDFDEKGQYVPVEPSVVVNGWGTVFTNFVMLMENNGKPCYRNEKGGILPIWMKLLRFTKVNNVWKPVVGGKSTQGDLGFTNFVGEGCIELFNNSTPPLMKVNPVKESITYKETKKEIVQPAIPVAGGTIASPVMGTEAGGMNFGAPNPALFATEAPTEMAGPEDLPF